MDLLQRIAAQESVVADLPQAGRKECLHNRTMGKRLRWDAFPPLLQSARPLSLYSIPAPVRTPPIVPRPPACGTPASTSHPPSPRRSPPSQSIDGGLEATGGSLGRTVSAMGVPVGSSETLVGSSRSWHAHKHSANISNGHRNRRIICCPLCRYESNFVRYAYATISRFRCSPPAPLVRISYIDLLDIPKISGLSVESYIIPFPA